MTHDYIDISDIRSEVFLFRFFHFGFLFENFQPEKKELLFKKQENCLEKQKKEEKIHAKCNIEKDNWNFFLDDVYISTNTSLSTSVTY